MAESLHNDETILRYVEGEMLPDEREQFEIQVAQDAALKEAVERVQLTIQSVQYAAIAERVKNIHQRLAPQLTPPVLPGTGGRVVSFRSRILRTSLAVAASVLLIVTGAGAYYVYQLSPDRLYDETYVPYSFSGSRSGTQAPSATVESAYQQKDYEGVIRYAQGKLLPGTQQLFVGLAYLQLNQLPAAIGQLKALLQTTPANAAVRQDAEYYLVLAFLKNKQYDSALPLMRAIHNNPDHPYQEQFSSRAIRDVQLLKWKR